MPKYRATRFINRREAEHCRFDAVSDDQAKEILTTLNEASEIQWESCEDSDCDPAAYDETLMLEKWSGDWSDATAGWAAVAEEILLPSQMPYSGHAIVFVNKVAAPSAKKAPTTTQSRRWRPLFAKRTSFAGGKPMHIVSKAEGCRSGSDSHGFRLPKPSLHY